MLAGCEPWLRLRGRCLRCCRHARVLLALSELQDLICPQAALPLPLAQLQGPPALAALQPGCCAGWRFAKLHCCT